MAKKKTKTKKKIKKKIVKKVIDEESKLTDKQQRFCEEYVVDFNATQAAARAGYSKKTSQQQGTENLAKPVIKKKIDELKKQFVERVNVKKEDIINELSKIAFSNFYANIIKLGKGKGLTIDEESTIAQFSETDTQFGTTKKYKGYDKIKALELLGKHLAMFTDNVNSTNTNVVTFAQGLDAVHQQLKSNPELLAQMKKDLVDE